MVVQEHLDNGLVRTYSNSGFKVHGGFPEGDYDIVYDPEDLQREYTETSIPVDAPVKIAEISKRKLYNNLVEADFWETVESYLKENGKWKDFLFAESILDPNDIIVKSIKDALKTLLDISDEQIEQIILNSLSD